MSYIQNGKTQDSDWIELASSHDSIKLPFAAQEDSLSSEKQQLEKKLTNYFRQCRTYQFHDTSKHAAIKKPHDTSDSVYLNSDGGNLAAVLLSLSEHEPKRLKLIEKQISRDGWTMNSQHLNSG